MRIASRHGGATDGSASAYSNSDVATTMTYVSSASGDLIAAVALDRMLDAVNRVRTAAGWASVTWANILGANDPLPAPGSLVVLHHFTSCRARMNEALQALGALGKVYTDSDLTRVDLKAMHINEILEAVR